MSNLFGSFVTSSWNSLALFAFGVSLWSPVQAKAQTAQGPTAPAPVESGVDYGSPDGEDCPGAEPGGGSTFRDALAGPTRQVLYIRYDTITLSTGGGDDAPNRVTYWSNLGGTWSSLGWSQSERNSVTSQVAQIFEPYNVEVTQNEPASGDYTMIIVASHPAHSAGYATLDCGNRNPNNIGFVTTDPNSSGANLIAHEAGHTFGLNHVWDEWIMRSSVPWELSSFANSCAGLNSNSCPTEHEQYCSAGYQNSHEELLGVFGPNGGDDDDDSVGDDDDDSVGDDDDDSVGDDDDDNAESGGTDATGTGTSGTGTTGTGTSGTGTSGTGTSGADTGSGSTGDTDGTGIVDTDGADLEDGDEACACSSRSSGSIPAQALLLGGLAFLVGRRRRD